ncbi:MAG: molybdate ABC transporter substrate-binding protein [Alphaproteobacteria bacterium]
MALFCATMAALALSVAPAHGDVLVFAASSLKEVIDAAASDFASMEGERIVTSYAASSALAKQIESGAPADLFISADREWMDYLADRKRIVPATRTNLAGNRLVLIAPNGSNITARIAPGFPLASLLGRGRLAIADPDYVPAGRYARTALERLGVWATVAHKLAPAENVRTALTFVARGEAALGIVYRTDALAETTVKVVDTFSADTHAPIIYPAALTSRTAKPAAAAFLAYLKSPKGQATFVRFGFTHAE